MSSDFIFSKLSLDLIKEILLYDTHFVLRKNNQFICIDKFSKEDSRYQLLDNIPKIFQLAPNSWSVILGKNTKYIIKHYLRPSNIWEYSFVIYSKDPQTNWFDPTPKSITCIPRYMGISGLE